jgi:hypothetical protein
MRVFVASLIVLSVLYFWDKDYNNGKLLDGLDSMGRAISHSWFHKRRAAPPVTALDAAQRNYNFSLRGRSGFSWAR